MSIFWGVLPSEKKLSFQTLGVSRNMWFAAENVVVMGIPYVLKGSSTFAKYVVGRGKCGCNGESIWAARHQMKKCVGEKLIIVVMPQMEVTV